MASLDETFGAVGDAIRVTLGLTRHGRIRRQIGETVGLYEQVSKHGPLQAAADDLALVIRRQSALLLAMTGRPQRQRNWASAVVSWVLSAGFGAGVYLASPHWGSWWGSLLAVVLGSLGALLAIAGIGMLLQESGPTTDRRLAQGGDAGGPPGR